MSADQQRQVNNGISLNELAIGLDKLVYVADHDGNIHPKDIGQDYLCNLLGYNNSEQFERAVSEIRDHPYPYTNSYLNGEVHSEGEELSILISNKEI